MERTDEGTARGEAISSETYGKGGCRVRWTGEELDRLAKAVASVIATPFPKEGYGETSENVESIVLMVTRHLRPYDRGFGKDPLFWEEACPSPRPRLAVIVTDEVPGAGGEPTLSTFKKKLVYVYDALCPWCYAFTPVVQSLRAYYGDHFEYEVLSGGMYRGDGVKSVGGKEEAERLRAAYGRIEALTGAAFGERFFESVAKGERRLDSEPVAAALAGFRILRDRGEATGGRRASELDFAHTVLRFVFQGGGDPTEPDFYKSVALELGLEPEALLTAIDSDEARDGAIYDFALVRQLGADGFPRLYLQTAEDYLHLVAKGYAPFEQVHAIIEKIESGS